MLRVQLSFHAWTDSRYNFPETTGPLHTQSPVRACNDKLLSVTNERRPEGGAALLEVTALCRATATEVTAYIHHDDTARFLTNKRTAVDTAV